MRSLLFCLALVCAGCAGAVRLDEAGKYPHVEGIVSHNSKSFAGATVALRRVENFALANAPVESVVSDEKGRFALNPAPGEYIVTAQAPGYFAFFGRNPLRVGADEKNLSLPLAESHVPTIQTVAHGSEGIEGRALYEGKPAQGVIVQAYLDVRNGFRGQPYASAPPTGEDGAFILDLEPGRYHVVARKRSDGHRTGPLEAGDLFGVLPELPLALATGTRARFDLETVKLPSAELMARYQTRFSVLTGTVVDEAGKPVAGFRPCLYKNPRMLDEPVMVGDPTGADGRFTLKTSRAGSLWLGARETLGGPPQSGERVGFMRPFPPDGIELAPGKEQPELTIALRRVP